ncbi:MAG: transcription-repair coupling factor [candidate division Zixibacteria bacterium]|nr:transcription-repair coupling factor [candidate division Zixibacteria bacterium]
MILQKLLKNIEALDSIKLLDEKLSGKNSRINISGLLGSSKAMIIAYACRKYLKPILAITSESEEAEALTDDLKSFLGKDAVSLFPTRGISPYEIRAPHIDIIGQRLLTLYNLNSADSSENNCPMVIVAPVEALLEKTISRQQLSDNSLYLRQGQQLERDRLITLLEKLNYQRSPMTEMIGEYSVRGGIVDIFTPTDEDPIRIEFFGDEIESIRCFSVLTQRSTKHTGSAFILPRREIIFDESIIEAYTEQLDEAGAQALHVALGDSGDYDGLEYIWPNLNIELSDLFEHLPDRAFIFVDNPQSCFSHIESVLDRAVEKFESVGDIPVASPGKVYLTEDDISKKIDCFQKINISSVAASEHTGINFKILPQEFFSKNLTYLKNRLNELHQDGYKLNILCESVGQRDRIEEIIDGIGAPVEMGVSWLSSGFAVVELKQWYLADHQIFTRHKKRRTFRRFKEGIALSSYSNLNPGDYVVHIDYGIGRFRGLETLVVDGRKRDCIALIYLGDDKLYVPVEEFHRVQKYAGKDGAPRLSKLGSGTWEKVKARAKKALMDIAGELIALYAERTTFPGFAFKTDSDWMHQLEASFEYQETPDQLKAMDEIKIDMEKPTPMDRLICGDVGYGKTELAVRAALKAVDSGKQAAILAPTTILAAQHQRTFSERFADFPIKIEMLSRFRTPKQVKEIKKGLSDGTIDIVIGTHKLLQKDVEFKDLGLLIVDEEQRFGVAHKEKIKTLRSQIDVLTMTATPIPRTLQLSLVSVRDMSIINTPPKDRLPINTEISRFSNRVIVDAINRELDRGGQVYIVHNRVQSIYAFHNYLKKYLPLVQIGIGHGQMPERELEKVMKDFLDKKFQILLSTTIIESGLDIPSVNTIIINRADRLGLAQLYQLRGRVGRSHFRAYAHLLIPPLKLLTRDARKRLKAIEEFTELGSGFHLAMKDLEIRGAGNLLGSQQHGYIEEVGFDLYIRLLEEAVAQLKGIRPEELASQIKITTDLDLFLPENYIPSSNQRVDIYRRFSGAEKLEVINELLDELNDRFGPPSEAAKNLASLAAIRIYGKRIGLESLHFKRNILNLEFESSNNINRQVIERWVSTIPEKIEFKYDRNFKVQITLKDNDENAEKVKKILQKMAD